MFISVCMNLICVYLGLYEIVSLYCFCQQYYFIYCCCYLYILLKYENTEKIKQQKIYRWRGRQHTPASANLALARRAD